MALSLLPTRMRRRCSGLLGVLLLAGCGNSPYQAGAEATSTLFTSFSQRSPRYLDPTSSYSSDETPFTFAIYEPLYGYAYLKRPYQLEPKTARALATPRYLDARGQPLPEDAPAAQIAHSVYELELTPGIRFAPHPAFARDASGRYRYHQLTRAELGDKSSPWQFEHRGTRELVAEDYVYAFKRHASPRVVAPLFGLFAQYVLGLDHLAEQLRAEQSVAPARSPDASAFLDLRRYPLEGVRALSSHKLQIVIRGKYPQWKYWLAMTFLAPVPWEADLFYAQPGMQENGLSLNTWPVGTGPYMMWESVQDFRHVLQRNPYYRHKTYPCEGTEEDHAAGLLADCGKRLPFIDRHVFSVEREFVALDAKFREGYLDVAELSTLSRGLAYREQAQDSERVRREFAERGIKLPLTLDLANSYLGFNWLDPVVGRGDTPEQQEKNRKLRHALSIAIDWEEHQRIFPSAAGEVAMSPLPGGLFGSRHGSAQGLNRITHRWQDGKAVRRPLEEARQLLAQAGYPDGRDARSGKPLVLYYDFGAQATPEARASLDWTRKQFAKLGIQLEIRASDYNQFQEKMRNGRHQIYTWGWLADYPDAENFLFLLYGPNSKAKAEGENAANYQNEEYDRLYERLRFMEDGPEKQQTIDRMVAIVQEDAPWSFGHFPYASGAYQPWVHNEKPSMMVRDHTIYYRLDTQQRAELLPRWNRPVYWPLALLLALLAIALLKARSALRGRERARLRTPHEGA